MTLVVVSCLSYISSFHMLNVYVHAVFTGCLVRFQPECKRALRSLGSVSGRGRTYKHMLRISFTRARHHFQCAAELLGGDWFGVVQQLPWIAPCLLCCQ